MRTRVSRVGFYLLCTLMSPVILIGYLMWVGKLFAAGRSGVSATAQGPLSARFSEHNFGTRHDEAADRLMRALPGVPRLGLRLTTDPVLLAPYRVTGYVPRAFRYPFEGDVAPQYQASARIWFLTPRWIGTYPTSRIVILGAGFDTRAYRLPSDTRVRVFEVDSHKPDGQARDAPEGWHRFQRGDIRCGGFRGGRLVGLPVRAGFASGERTLFLWEGVTSTSPGRPSQIPYGKSLRRRRVLWSRLTTSPPSPRVTDPLLALREGRHKVTGETPSLASTALRPHGNDWPHCSDPWAVARSAYLGDDTPTRRAWGGSDRDSGKSSAYLGLLRD